jgi:hypothetical protein
MVFVITNETLLDELEALFNTPEYLKGEAKVENLTVRKLQSFSANEKIPSPKAFILTPRQRNERDGADARDVLIPRETDAKYALEGFTLTLPPSTNIQSAYYEPPEQKLTCSFKSGSSYVYSNVPFATIKAWMLASSAGSYHYYNIRKSFAYSKL